MTLASGAAALFIPMGLLHAATSSTKGTPFIVAMPCSAAIFGLECTSNVTVPANNLWVIKTISGFCSQPDQTNPVNQIHIETTVAGHTGSVFVVPSLTKPGNGLAYTFTQSIETYAGPQKPVSFHASTSLPLQMELSCEIYLSGLAVPP